MRNPIKLLLCSATTLVFSSHAIATVESTWTLTGTPTAGVTVAAYANTGGANTYANKLQNGALQTIQSATLKSYSGGIGITNADKCTSGTKCDLNEGSSPEHAIDNQQRYDMALLSFDAPVQLTAIKLGWKYNDSDITVLAYTGSGEPNVNGDLVGLKYGDLVPTTSSVGNGWTSIGHYADVATTAPMAINALQLVSSYWLIGAYNPLAITPLANTAGTTFDAGSYDYVKLASVMGFMAVPEPSSIALIGLALVGLIALRRRERA